MLGMNDYASKTKEQLYIQRSLQSWKFQRWSLIVNFTEEETEVQENKRPIQHGGQLCRY
jgi:hypothetical protein